MISKYLSTIFNKEFIPMFFVLFSIMSIIVTVDIANFSSVLELSFWDFFKLYMYQVPMMILYVVPILYFISMANSIKKSCLQSELLVMFSLGLKPIRMFKIYVVSSIFLAIFLLIITLAVRPLSEYLNTRFIHNTETTQNINLSKSDFGQKFGNWFFFINKENDTFKNIILFNKEKGKDTIVIADEVKIGDNKNSFELQMRNGKAYISSNNELVQINYDKMSVFDSIIIDKLDYSNLIEYWKRYKTDNVILKHLVLGVNIALFPIFSIYGIFGIAFIKPRISKDKVGIYTFYYIASFVFLIHLFLSYIGIWTIVVIPILFTIVSYVIYRLRMK